jgi:arylsulfatase A-like enzyme
VRVRTEVGLALSVGLVGGTVFGAREALVTLDTNAFVQPGHYFSVYLAFPILTCMALGVLLLLPAGVAAGLLGRCGGGARSLAIYAALLGLAGGLAVSGSWVMALLARLRLVGFEPGVAAILALWLLAGALAAGTAAAAGAAAAWYGARRARPLRWARRAALALAILLLWPVGRWVVTDWRWAPTRPTPAAPAGAGVNVLLVSIDTLRADHLGSYGSPDGLTPHLDRLAREGVTFRQAITSAPWTLPAVGSLLTGLSPRHHGAGAVTNRRDPLGRSPLAGGSWTLAGALRARGYRTQAIVTNPYLALRYGLGQGFDGYENLTIESEFFLAGREVTALRLLAWLRPDLVVGDRGETVSARATAWLGRAAGGGPFFLWLHYIDPHPPYSRAGVARHKSFRSDTLLGARDAASGDGPFTLTSPDVARLRAGELRLSAGQKAQVRSLYRAEVASVDAAVGQVLAALDRLGLAGGTLVVCVSDHGEEFWEHGGVEHGHTVYEELVRVPLLMRLPGTLPAGAVVDAPARMTDIAPTAVDLLGLAPPLISDGASLLPLVRGEEVSPRPALIESMLFAEERVGVRTPERKYVRWDSGKEEAYDLAADPGELRDLAALPAVMSPLRELYASLAHGLGEQPVAAPGGPSPASGAAALRALGYLH